MIPTGSIVRHSRVGGNPALLFKMPLAFVLAAQGMYCTTWIPACAGMTWRLRRI